MTDGSQGSRNWRGLSVLVVSPTPTHPQDHGNRKRIFEICSELKRQGAEIHFIYYAAEQDWRDHRPMRREREMAAAWDSFQLVLPSRPLHQSARAGDHLIDEWQDPALAGCIRWYCKTRKYDAVIVNYTWLSFCFDHVPQDVFKILDTHDVFSDRRAMLEKNGIAPEFFHTTRQEEAKAIARADLVWAIKPSEREFFERELGANLCLTMLHAEPEKDWWNGAVSKDGWLRAGVIGARNNVNRRNLEMFFDAALPIFEKYMAPVKIMIGGGCADDFADIDKPNIEIMGRVGDVADFYRKMDVVIVPMQFSTGLKIKVCEALAAGAPLLAHAHATEGYPVTEPMHRLANFEAIAHELAVLSFDRARLPALAAASHAASAEIRRDVLSAIEQTRRYLIDSMTPAICLVLPLCALDKETMRLDQVNAVLDCLRADGPVVIHLTGEAGRFDPDLLRFGGGEAMVFVGPTLAAELGETIPESWRSMGFADMVQSREIDSAYFLDIAPGGAQDWAKQNVRDVRRVAYESSRHPANLVQRHDRKSGDPGILVLGNENDLLVPVLRDLGQRLGFSTTILDPAQFGAGGDPPPPEKQAACMVAVGRARLVVDLTRGDWLSAAIDEAAMRDGIPIVRCARGMAGLVRHNESGDGVAMTVGGFLRSVARALADGAYRRKLCRKSADEVADQTQNADERIRQAGPLQASNERAAQSSAARLLFQ